MLGGALERERDLARVGRPENLWLKVQRVTGARDTGRPAPSLSAFAEAAA